MTRDYSKKKATKRKPSATPKVNNKKSVSGLIYLIVGLSIGLFIAFLVYIDQQPVSSSKNLVHPANKNTHNSKAKSKLPAK
ncbi:MAG: hypothetical protein QM504_03590, partial [Pseudomonadota bacterium]